MRGGRFGFKFCDTIIKLIRVVPGLSQGLVNNRGTIRYFCCNSPNEKRIRPIFMGRPLLFNGGIIRDINSLHLRHPEMSLVSATSKEAKSLSLMECDAFRIMVASPEMSSLSNLRWTHI